jgi:hypothetical protein
LAKASIFCANRRRDSRLILIGLHSQIKEFLKLAFITTGFVGIAMILLIIFTPNTLANLFLEDNNYKTKEIVLKFATYIWIIFLFDGFNLVISSYLTAIHKPSLLQQRMNEAKLLGRKTGKGFYDYSEQNQESRVKNQEIVKDESLYEMIFLRIISMLINEAVEAKRLGIANNEDIETAMQKGVNYPKGLLNWGKEIGYPKISEVLQNLYEEYQEERYRQSPLLRKLN